MDTEERQIGPEGPTKIRTLIDRILVRKNLQRRLKMHQVFSFWDELVGREIAALAQPSLIRGNVLWVAVRESVWMQQLHLQKMLLLEKINERLEENKLGDIRFKLESSLERPVTPAPPRKTPPPTEKEKRDFDQLISTVKDEDIKAALRSFWEKLHTRE